MNRFKHLLSSAAGTIAVPAAITIAALLLLVGGALDMASVSNQKSTIQDLADNASLAAVNELAISADDVDRIKQVALAYATNGNFQINSLHSIVNLESREVTVDISVKPKTNFPAFFGEMNDLSASATARLSGRGGNICMIGLSPVAMSTLRLRSRAQITADSCAIYSNSTSTSSLSVASTASVNADLICVAGGYKAGAQDDALSSMVLEDCSPVSDPLEMRSAPVYDACDFQDTVITNAATLMPGVYCGGIVVDGGQATLSSGEYIITGGPLHVTNNGTLEGDHVGFYLSGPEANLQFDYDSNISLSAPREGVLAGLLLFSSPFDTSLSKIGKANIDGRKTDGVKKPDHYIRSDNARRLVGTIYLPNGKLLIDGRDPIADLSEYTVIIADTFELQDGPNLVLRTDYHLSDIPVPEGVGPTVEQSAFLVN